MTSSFSNRLLAISLAILIFVSVITLFLPSEMYMPMSRLTGMAPSANETGIVNAEIVSFVSLNLTDKFINIGNVTNGDIFNTSFEGHGARPDTILVINSGASPTEIEFWAKESLFYDKLNYTAKKCNGNATATGNCRLNAAKTESDPSFQFSTEGLTGTGCLVDAYELSSGYKNVVVDGEFGVNAPAIADQIAGGDSFNITVRIEVPSYEESGDINATIYVSGIEDSDGKDPNC